ncbi:MAG: tetratricopeptide repeat protein [Flavipsychrobacter sp.]|nr:tetratricopeptide repeat protein [Flavipsychrobacter sp.]
MKYTTQFLLMLLLCSGTFFLPSCSEKKEEVPALLERKKPIGPDEEKAAIRKTYDKALEAVKKDPDDLKQYIALATAFISEGRVTGNNGYYSNAAVQMLDKVTTKTTANKDLVFQALSLKSAVLLNMHQFKEAAETAKQGVALNDFNAGIYGALVDANVELGNYKEAVADCDKMMSIRPDLRSYSRASYLRQIYGQNSGSIEAMKLAVGAGMPGAENTEWARTTLADLYLNNGNADSAALLYRESLVYRPNYPFAMIGMARVGKARKNYDTAIAYTKNAIGVLSEAAFVSLLADLYELKGDAAKAKETRNDVVGLLEEGQKEEPKDAAVKHNVSREMATAYLNAGNLDKALPYAQTDLEMRPENIDANELVAWIYYLKGDYTNAKIHADKMLATNTKNANKLYEAGAIYASAGDMTKGNELMAEATKVSPYIDQRIINQTRSALVMQKQ